MSGIDLLSHIYKNFSRFTGAKGSPTGGSECGPKKSQLMSGTNIVRLIQNGGRYSVRTHAQNTIVA
ncbi:hypothetical protein QUB70_05205 [Microcoleus sp. A003_D6]|uniref:hypothetical protein n=1 Tax=Microcoleus sp. A003_D6 TaxID=3055266 RepID=UPI002FD6E36C